jgi:hypothetical protein
MKRNDHFLRLEIDLFDFGVDKCGANRRRAGLSVSVAGLSNEYPHQPMKH